MEHLRPKLLIIGAQKAGTTALWTYLARHPMAAPPKEKELNFFSCNSRYRRGLDFYHSYFPVVSEETGGKLTFEASPDYLRNHVAAAERIQKYDPEMKLVALLRNPITRAYSAWHMYRRYALRDRSWFFQWVRACNAEMGSDAFTRRSAFGESFEHDIVEELEGLGTRRPIEMPLLPHGLYYGQLLSYFRRFGKERVFVESSERFLSGAQETIHAVENFLGLDDHRRASRSLEPVFVGDYDEGTIPRSAVETLRGFYREANLRLYGLLGRDFGW